MTKNTWMPITNLSVLDYPIDFFASMIHFFDHLAPIWLHIPEDRRGNFYVPENLVDYALIAGIEATGIKPRGKDPSTISPLGKGSIVTCSYRDLREAIRSNQHRPQIFMEHGVGISFPEHAPGYAGGVGYRKYISLFLAPNKYVAAKTEKTFPGVRQAIVGTPKMDKYAHLQPRISIGPPTICVSFHWDGSKVCPEAGNAWNFYKHVLPELTKHYKVLGHAHPRIFSKLEKEYSRMDIEPVATFDEVVRRTDIYINDSSSTLFEFAALLRPVVILNAPWFRKSVNYGIRWWDFTDIGPQCETPGNLLSCISIALRASFVHSQRQMRNELYPHWGNSASYAASAISAYCKEYSEY
jgi:hypothetical protein